MNLIAHVEIPVRELERAMAFYSALFGIGFGEIVELHASRMAWFPFTPGVDGASGALAEGEVYVPTTDGAIVYFAVGDIDAALARATVASRSSHCDHRCCRRARVISRVPLPRR